MTDWPVPGQQRGTWGTQLIDKIEEELEERDTGLADHLADASNPHGVTAAQVGALTQAQADLLYPDKDTTEAAIARVDPGSVNVLGDGTVSGNGTTDDTTALQAILTANAGGHILIPTPSGTHYEISAALTVPGNTRITVDPQAIIEQTTKYKPVFDCLDADNVVIDGGQYRYTGSRTYTSPSSFRGDGGYVYSAAVWSNGSYGRFTNLHASGFTVGVHLSSWNGSALTDYHGQSNVVDNIEVEDVDFGVLFTGQSDPTLTRVRGSVEQSSGAAGPPHLIYGSNGAANRNVNGDAWSCWDNAVGHAFQLKGITGGTVTNMTARNCVGDLSLLAVNDMRLAVSSTDSGDTGNNGALYMQDASGGCNRNVIDAQINKGASDRAARIAGTGNKVNLSIRARHPSQADTYDVDISGTNNEVEYSIRNVQDDGTDYASAWRGVLCAGTNTILRPRVMRNCRIEIDLTSATNYLLDLTNLQSTLAATSGLYQVGISSSTGRILWPPAYRAVSATTSITQLDETVAVDVTGEWWAMNLPAAANLQDKTLTFIKSDSGSNGIQVVPNGSDTIKGPGIASSAGTPMLIRAQWSFATIRSVLTGWVVVAMGGNVDDV